VLSEKEIATLVIIYTNKIYLSDVIRVIEGEVSVQYKSVYITLHTDQVQMVQRVEVVYRTSWKATRQSWVRRGAEVEQKYSNISEMIYMASIAG